MGSLHTQMLMRVFLTYQVMKLGSASRLIIKMMDRFCYLGKICFNSGMKTAEGSQNCCSTCIFFVFSCSLLIKLKV